MLLGTEACCRCIKLLQASFLVVGQRYIFSTVTGTSFKTLALNRYENDSSFRLNLCHWFTRMRPLTIYSLYLFAQ